MVIQLIERVDGSDGDIFEMNCDEPRVAAVEYFEHRGSNRVREEGSFMIEVYEVGSESERVRFECSRDGVERVR